MKIVFGGMDEYMERLAALGPAAEDICKYAIYDAAGMVIEAVKASVPKLTGDLKNSMGLTDMTVENGFVFTELTFNGYDRNGVPNLLKARVLESGSSKQQKKPFIRQAINSVREQAIQSIKNALDKKLNEIMNKPGD